MLDENYLQHVWQQARGRDLAVLRDARRMLQGHPREVTLGIELPGLSWNSCLKVARALAEQTPPVWAAFERLATTYAVPRRAPDAALLVVPIGTVTPISEE